MVTKVAIVALFALAMFTALYTCPWAKFADAQAESNSVSLSGEEVAKAKEIATADSNVQKYFAGRTYSLMSYGALTNDNEPNVVRPMLVYNIDNKDQLTVTVDLKTNAVIDVQYHPDFIFQGPSKEPDTSTSINNSQSLLMAITIGIASSVVLGTVFIMRRRKSSNPESRTVSK